MQRAAALRSVLASSSAIVFQESHSRSVMQRNARADSIPVGLHTLQVNLKKAIPIPIVLKKKMEPLRSISINGRRANSVLQRKIEKPVVVIIAPSRDFVRRSG